MEIALLARIFQKILIYFSNSSLASTLKLLQHDGTLTEGAVVRFDDMAAKLKQLREINATTRKGVAMKELVEAAMFHFPAPMFELQPNLGFRLTQGYKLEEAMAEFTNHCLLSSVELLATGFTCSAVEVASYFSKWGPCSALPSVREKGGFQIVFSSIDALKSALAQEPLTWEGERVHLYCLAAMPSGSSMPCLQEKSHQNRALAFKVSGDTDLVSDAMLRTLFESLSSVDGVVYHPEGTRGMVFFKQDVADSILQVVFHRGGSLALGDDAQITLEKTTVQVEMIYQHVLATKKASLPKKNPIQRPKRSTQGKTAKASATTKPKTAAARIGKKKSRAKTLPKAAESAMDALLEQFKF
ncbi:hypothetical protein HDV03_002319 [Kappamyces sp. JEL0829]|nr:hypothetical protein HDV03_002319 [Kappamyces sp. JEL0829]